MCLFVYVLSFAVRLSSVLPEEENILNRTLYNMEISKDGEVII